MHQNSIFKENSIPLFCSHYRDVKRAGILIVFDGIEKILVIVRQEPRIGKTSLSKYMVSEEYFMKQAVPELWIGGSLKKRSNKEG